jgi:hypothetical protein
MVLAELPVCVVETAKKEPFAPLTDSEFPVKSGGMERFEFPPVKIVFRPGALAPVGDFFIQP